MLLCIESHNLKETQVSNIKWCPHRLINFLFLKMLSIFKNSHLQTSRFSGSQWTCQSSLRKREFSPGRLLVSVLSLLGPMSPLRWTECLQTPSEFMLRVSNKLTFCLVILPGLNIRKVCPPWCCWQPIAFSTSLASLCNSLPVSPCDY